MKKRYQITLSHDDLIEAKDEEDAVEKYFESNVECSQQTPTTFISENLKIKQAFLASELKGEAVSKVMENHGTINVEEIDWAYSDEGPFLDIEELGIGIDDSKICWDLDYPHRQIYFTTAHDGKDRSLGIWIKDMRKLVKALIKDIKLPAKIAKAILDGQVELVFDTQYYGGGDGRTHFEFEDRTDKGVTEIKDFDFGEALNGWYNDKIANFLLSHFQQDYDYLTSEKTVIETLDANELLFTKDGENL